MKNFSLSVILVICSTQAGSVTFPKDEEDKLLQKLNKIELETASMVADMRSSTGCKVMPDRDEIIRMQLRTTGHSALYQYERYRLDYCKFKISEIRIDQDTKKELAITQSIESSKLESKRLEIRNLSFEHYAHVSNSRSLEESSDICNAFSYLYTAKFKGDSAGPIHPVSAHFDGAYYQCQFSIRNAAGYNFQEYAIQVKYDHHQRKATQKVGNVEIDLGDKTHTYVTRVQDRGFVGETDIFKTFNELHKMSLL